jgi:hypothetical protein
MYLERLSSMKIASGETLLSIDFVETILAGEKLLDGLFSANVDIKTATFSGKGENIWFSLREFEQFIRDLKMIEKDDVGNTMFQTTIEASEDYGKVGDHLNIQFSKTTATHLYCTTTLEAHRKDLYRDHYTQILIHSFGLDRSTISNLIGDFEGLKVIIIQDLERRAKEEKFYD